MRIVLKIGSKFLPFMVEWYSRMLAFFSTRSVTSNSISIINTQDQGGGAAKIAYTVAEYSSYKEQISFFVHEKNNTIMNIKVKILMLFFFLNTALLKSQRS